MITLRSHASSQYAPRTEHNARQGLTLAFAVDHTTAGEKLTQKCARGRIVKLSPSDFVADPIKSVNKVIDKLKELDCRVLNVAGNGIYTWAAHGFDQSFVNMYVSTIITSVNHVWRLDKVVSGGQSGTDIAGLIAAAQLGIPCEGMWPKGFKMRFEDGIDRYHTREQIMEILNQYA